VRRALEQPLHQLRIEIDRKCAERRIVEQARARARSRRVGRGDLSIARVDVKPSAGGTASSCLVEVDRATQGRGANHRAGRQPGRAEFDNAALVGGRSTGAAFAEQKVEIIGDRRLQDGATGGIDVGPAGIGTDEHVVGVPRDDAADLRDFHDIGRIRRQRDRREIEVRPGRAASRVGAVGNEHGGAGAKHGTGDGAAVDFHLEVGAGPDVAAGILNEQLHEGQRRLRRLELLPERDVFVVARVISVRDGRRDRLVGALPRSWDKARLDIVAGRVHGVEDAVAVGVGHEAVHGGRLRESCGQRSGF
jgi:hypothetical protein